MGLSKLNQLYMTLVTDHAKSPHHYGTLAVDPMILHNPSCGDVIQLFAIWENGKLVDLAFTGSGCSISMASASMMTDSLIGQDVNQVEKALQAFSKLLQSQPLSAEEKDLLGDAVSLSGVTAFPQRIKCANLAWQALAHSNEKYKQNI